MAIIKPSKKFIGSNLNSNNASRYIKEGTKLVSFSTPENKEGVHLLFLPPYKADAQGNGVWFKVVRIRDNFGDRFKEKYAVSPDYPDPVDHFERNFKIHFPEEAKVVEEMTDKGQSRKRYPFYGRKTTRVLYNTAYASKMELGPHILDLPNYMGASQIMDWLESRDARGRERPMINDPAGACPVFVRLKDGGSGNPWQIIIDPNEKIPLPDELADSEQIYNLDDIIEYRDPQELLNKLYEMYPSGTVDLCMEGYEGPATSSKGSADPAPVQAAREIARTASATLRPAARPTPAPAQAAQKVAVGLQAMPEDEADEIPMDFVDDEAPESPPTVAAPTRKINSADEARAFLSKRRPTVG